MQSNIRLETDLQLAVANRAEVPWIITTSHFPIFCTGCAGNGVSAAAYYASPAAEYHGNANASAAALFAAAADAAEAVGAGAGLPAANAANAAVRNQTARSSKEKSKLSTRGASDDLVTDIAPLLAKYGVDLMMAGHWSACVLFLVNECFLLCSFVAL